MHRSEATDSNKNAHLICCVGQCNNIATNAKAQNAITPYQFIEVKVFEKTK